MSPPAKFPSVSISLMGRAHGYNLAAELNRLGHLDTLYSSQPKFRTAQWGVPGERVTVTPTWEVARQIAGRARLLDKIPHLTYFTFDAHDRAVARRLRPADVMIAWYHVGLRTLRRARELGAKTIIERGSTHMRFQQELLDEEHARWGQPRVPPRDPWMVERAEQEYAEADAIAVPSHWVKRSFLAMGVPAEKLIHVPYGVDLEEFVPGEGQREDPTFRAVFAGALTLQKGIPYLLEAVKQAGVKVWLFGGVFPELAPFLSRYEGAYELFGHVPQRTLRDRYVQCDVFVMPSVQEGLSMVIPQALACGLPVICTTNTGGEDVVRHGETGFIVPPRRPDLMAERLTQLKEDPDLLARMKASARRSMEGHRGWGEYGRDLVTAYTRLAAGEPATARPAGAWAVGQERA